MRSSICEIWQREFCAYFYPSVWVWPLQMDRAAGQAGRQKTIALLLRHARLAKRRSALAAIVALALVIIAPKVSEAQEEPPNVTVTEALSDWKAIEAELADIQTVITDGKTTVTTFTLGDRKLIEVDKGGVLRMAGLAEGMEWMAIKNRMVGRSKLLTPTIQASSSST